MRLENYKRRKSEVVSVRITPDARKKWARLKKSGFKPSQLASDVVIQAILDAYIEQISSRKKSTASK